LQTLKYKPFPFSYIDKTTRGRAEAVTGATITGNISVTNTNPETRQNQVNNIQDFTQDGLRVKNYNNGTGDRGVVIYIAKNINDQDNGIFEISGATTLTVSATVSVTLANNQTRELQVEGSLIFKGTSINVKGIYVTSATKQNGLRFFSQLKIADIEQDESRDGLDDKNLYTVTTFALVFRN